MTTAVRRMISIATLVFALANPCVAAAFDNTDPLLGRWEGAILVRPAELEVGLTLDVRRSNGQLEGRISFPTQSSEVHQVAQLDAQGSGAQWIYKDPSGDPSFFEGVLSDDRQQLSGTVRDGGKVMRFTLLRVTRPPSPPRVIDLAPDGTELRSLFDSDASDVRLLMILSPSCAYCRSNARIVQAYVLDRIKNPNLKVYVVWERVNADDSEALAREFASLMSDPRATHLWSEHRFTGNSFRDVVGATSAPPWDLALLFRPGERWTSRAPAPDFFMYDQRISGRDSQPIQGVKLAEKVAGLLRAQPAP